MEKRPVLSNKFFKFVLFLAILAGCWYLGRVFNFDVSYYRDILSKYPVGLSGAIFIILYVLVTTFFWFGPKDVFRVSSAVLFGPYVSTVFIWISEMISALIMFHLSRILGRDYVRQKLGMKFKEFDGTKDKTSFLGIVVCRINPLIPFRVMDLGYGLTAVSFIKYFMSITLPSVFRILWLQSIVAGVGAGLFKDTSAIFDYFMEHPDVLQYSVIYFLVVFILTVGMFVARVLRKKK